MMPQVAEVEAFRHLADSYRWLVCAECSISDLRRVFDDDERAAATSLLPNADVAMVSSALVYGRALIEFYSEPSDHFQDLTAASAFGYTVPAGSPELGRLLSFKPANNAHLMHLSNRRERYERDGVDRIEWAGRPGGAPGRIHVLVDDLLALLQQMGQAASSGTALSDHWESLHDLACRRRSDRRVRWSATWDLDGVA